MTFLFSIKVKANALKKNVSQGLIIAVTTSNGFADFIMLQTINVLHEYHKSASMLARACQQKNNNACLVKGRGY